MTNEPPLADSLDVSWFDGVSSRMRNAQLEVTATTVRVRAREGTGQRDDDTIVDVIAEQPASAVKISTRIGNSPYRIEFPDGGLAVCTDAKSVERAFRLDLRSQWLSRLERASVFVAIALAGILIALYVGYQRFIPAAAGFAARQIPYEAERALGDATLGALRRNGFWYSNLKFEEKQAISKEFADLATAAGLSGVVELQFSRARPNALALPGGIVLVDDSLVALFRKDRSMLRAVLAHELGHVVHRDTLRLLLTGSATAIIVGTIAGDVSGVSGLMLAAPTLMTTLSFKRNIEAQADVYAFELLRKTGDSPLAFANAMRLMTAMNDCVALRSADRAVANRSPGPTFDRYQDDPDELSASSESPARPPALCFSNPEAYLQGRDEDFDMDANEDGAFIYLSTHPITDDRIRAAETAAVAK